MDVLPKLSAEEEKNKADGKVEFDMAAVLQGMDIFFGSEYPADADLEKDRRLILETTAPQDLRKNEYNYKFFRIQTNSALKRVQSLLLNNPNFQVTELKNALYMSIIEYISDHHFEKLYSFDFWKDFDFGEKNQIKSNGIKSYLKEANYQALPAHIKQVFSYTFEHLLNAGYCKNTALQTFSESLADRKGTFVQVGDKLFYFKTDKLNKTGINLHTGEFGMFSDYAQSLLLRTTKLLKENHSDDAFFKHVKDEISVTKKDGFTVITFHDDSTEFATSALNSYRAHSENVFVSAPEELKKIAQQARTIYDSIA